MKQYEAVIHVMRANGGYATLALLYQECLAVPDVVWNTKTPFKSINRIVQTNDAFFKLKPGLWALEEYRNRLPTELLSGINSSKPEDVGFNHTFYQRLLIEIGNWQGFDTFVPTQDKNRISLGKKLDEITSVKEIPQFTHSKFVKRASTIDVIWFNERKMPQAFYEVEHTTDIQNSLLKFFDLQDFTAEFFIVSDISRKGSFDRKIVLEAFRPIKERVKFRNYDYIAKWHENISQNYALKQLEKT
jgi:hypothetical protein